MTLVEEGKLGPRKKNAIEQKNIIVYTRAAVIYDPFLNGRTARRYRATTTTTMYPTVTYFAPSVLRILFGGVYRGVCVGGDVRTPRLVTARR